MVKTKVMAGMSKTNAKGPDKLRSVGVIAMQLIGQDVDRLKVTSALFKKLFATDFRRKCWAKLLPTAGSVIYLSLRESLIIGTGRLLFDNEEAGKHNNLSLQTLLNRMPLRRLDLEEELNELRRDYEPIRLARHKIFAHRDEERSYSVVYGEDEEIRLVTDGMLSNVVGRIADLYERILENIVVPSR